MTTAWADENPYYLLCYSEPDHVKIDLGERGWATTYADWMRKPGEWHLIRKDGEVAVLSIRVLDGDQPYYTARTFGNNKTDRQTKAYGIGKKRPDGSMTRLWILENGLVCGGDDVDEFAPLILM